MVNPDTNYLNDLANFLGLSNPCNIIFELFQCQTCFNSNYGIHLFVGNAFVPGEGIDHAWNAVFISGSWRLLDCTWGAGKTDALGQHFKKQLDEHFFITDPDELIYTHFPYDEVS